MFRNTRIFAMVAAVLLALVFSVGATGRASAQSSSACDTTGTVNGTATPTYGTVNSTIIFRGTGFTPREDVSFWFTTPTQEVFGTANPIEGGAAPDGSVGIRLTVPQEFVDFAPGKWAITIQGASSNNTAVIYFCLLTTEQATQVAQPATATPVPPTAVPATATSAPATATTAPATATTVATTAPAVSPTTAAAVSPTTAPVDTAVPATATTGAAVPTDTAVPVMPMESPTAEAIPTEVMPVSTPEGGALPGMPTTGQSDTPMLLSLLLAALGLLGIGVMARRAKTTGR
ncbi:MAG TPA: hypothetical protein VFG99_12060 [Chloroflexia bacterium]|nr:hypothetical protein [Chloroflexia bacterium]